LKIRSGLYFGFALLLFLAGCSSVTAPTQPVSTAPVALPQEITPQTETPQTVSPQESIPRQPGESIVVVPEPKPVMSGNRAVIALLDRAQRDNDAGRRGAADTSLERALRIEPRNPWLWHELAQLRLTQGQYAQAISLAKKSNSFAGHERHLQALNWRLIGNALVAQGDTAGAEQAFKHATDLEQVG
jgi:predicted Zn-dependent protease